MSKIKQGGMDRLQAYNQLTSASDILRRVLAQASWETSGLNMNTEETAKLGEAHQALMAALRVMEENS